MITSSQYKLNWEHFEDVNPNKREAFENMCRSLFFRTKSSVNEILHSNPNHPGVEVNPVYSKDGKERISFQAKYFDGRVEYRKILKSIKEAVEYFKGDLNKIYIYSNKDISMTSKQYREIEKYAEEAGIDLIPITKQSILEEVMEFPTILASYFGVDRLDKDWFEKNLQISLDNLGQRYNSKFNIDTEAKRKLSLFLRDNEGIKELNNKKKDAIEYLNNLRWRCYGEYRSIINQFINEIESIPDASSKTISDVLLWKDLFDGKNKEIFDKINNSERIIRERIQNESQEREAFNKSKEELYIIRKLKEVSDVLCVSESEKTLLSCNTVIVSGDMGRGKTQLLASSAKKSLETGRASLLVLGQTFISENPIDIQILNGLSDIDSNESFEALLGVMDEMAFINNDYAVLFIDAINESRDRDIWKEGINRLLYQINQYKNILLVISIRSGFERIMFCDKVLAEISDGRIATLVHRGLVDKSPKGVFEFLSNYGIPASPEYFLKQEMTNPLFLSWFCKTYTGDEQDLTKLIASLIKKTDEEASKEAGNKESLGLLKCLLHEYMEHAERRPVSKKKLLELKSWDLYGVNNKIAYINAIDRAGILISYVINDVEYYYIGYNLLEEYIRADWIIENNKTKEEIKDYCINNLLKVDNCGNPTKVGNESQFAMLSTLYAIKFNEECIEIIDYLKDGWEKSELVEEYIKTYTWRNFKAPLNQIVDIIEKYNVNREVLWELFIESASKINSTLNAYGLTDYLNNIQLNKRDSSWTIFINELTENDRIVSFAYYLEEGNDFSEVSDETAELLLTLYSWMLSSSNRILRDRVSKAMVEVLKKRFILCTSLLERFKDVNDPYIIQRLYGIIFGSVMKRTHIFESEFEELSLKVYKEIFLKEKIYPDILLRDYARLIIERFIIEFPDKKSVFDLPKIRPPYTSEAIPQVDEVDYDNERFHESGVWRILYSLKFDLDVSGVGMYGDFGRYVFQSALANFQNVEQRNIYYYALQYIFNDLGYSNELFGEYDSSMADFDRNDTRHIERIGKKYEWITMYNILARISDSYKLGTSYGSENEEEDYSGPWNPYVRDFDPTLNIRIKVDKSHLPQFDKYNLGDECFIETDSNEDDIHNWVCGDDNMFNSFPERFIVKDKNGTEWVSLYLYQENKKKIPQNEEYSFYFPRGEQQIWAISSLHIVKEEKDISIDFLKENYSNNKMYFNSARESYSLFSREYAWSPGYYYEFKEETDETNIWNAAEKFVWEEQCDASQNETTSFYYPTGEIIRELKLYQKDLDGVFYFNEEVAALDTIVTGSEYHELLLRRDLFDDFVKKSKYKFFWDIFGEKQFFLGERNQDYKRREGFFVYKGKGIEGEIFLVDKN